MHFSRPSGRRELALAFVSAFGLIWLALEPLGLFFPGQLQWRWSGYLPLVGLSLLWAAYRARPRTAIVRRLPPTDMELAIRVGDVLAQTGNVIVGANDTFDTQLDDDIISRRSVQGQLLERVFDGDRTELDRQINQALAGLTTTTDATKSFGKALRYEIGTVAQVSRGETRFFLTAFARMSSDRPPHVRSTVEWLQISLARLWRTVDEAGQREPVHVPVIGSHLARLGVSRTILIQMIVLSFIAAQSRSASLTVWVGETDLSEVDMTELAEWLRGLCAV